MRHKTKKGDQTQSSITFSTVYSPQFNQVVDVIKKHLPLLTVEDDMQNILGLGLRFVAKGT